MRCAVYSWRLGCMCVLCNWLSHPKDEMKCCTVVCNSHALSAATYPGQTQSSSEMHAGAVEQEALSRVLTIVKQARFD